jgi:hypothetical protein
MSKRQATKIRSLHKQGKLSPAELAKLRDRCINEAIRHVQKRPQKKLAHNVNCPQVKERYVEAVKASKEFSPLAKIKTPNDKIFRKFIQKCKQQSPDGTLRHPKRMVPNTEMTEDQSKCWEAASEFN